MPKIPHTHWCDCGSFFVCWQEADHCAIPEPYVCLNCEQQQLDDYLATQLDTTQPTQEPMTDEKH